MTGKPKKQELLLMFLSGRQVLSNTNISEISKFSGLGQEEKQTLRASTSYFLSGDRLQTLVEAIVAFVNTQGKGSWRSFLEWVDLCSLLLQSRFDVLAFIALVSCVIMTFVHQHVTDRSGKKKKTFQKESKHGGICWSFDTKINTRNYGTLGHNQVQTQPWLFSDCPLSPSLLWLFPQQLECGKECQEEQELMPLESAGGVYFCASPFNYWAMAVIMLTIMLKDTRESCRHHCVGRQEEKPESNRH